MRDAASRRPTARAHTRSNPSTGRSLLVRWVFVFIITLSVILTVYAAAHATLVPRSTPSVQTSDQAAAARSELRDFDLDLKVEDARVNDLNNRFSDLTLYLGGFGILVALTGVGLSFLALSTAGQRARDAAQEWMDDHTDELQKTIEALRAQADNATRLIEGKVEEVQRIAEGARDKIERATSTGTEADLAPIERRA